MNDETAIARIKDISGSIWNFACQFGPFLISQSDKMSQAFARHKMRLAVVDVMKETSAQELQNLQEVKKSVYEKYVKASMEDRPLILRDIDYLEGESRRVETCRLGLQYFSKQLEEVKEEENTSDETKGVSPHWMDIFNEMARAKNENWRKDLLAKALALEATNPGSISPRALWFIGTIEEEIIHAFATLLDISMVAFPDALIIPSVASFANQEMLTWESDSGGMTISNALHIVGETGILSDVSNSGLHMKPSLILNFSYGDFSYNIGTTKYIYLKGAIPTKMGLEIAALYTVKINPLGEEIFKTWIESLNAEIFNITPIKPFPSNP